MNILFALADEEQNTDNTSDLVPQKSTPGDCNSAHIVGCNRFQRLISHFYYNKTTDAQESREIPGSFRNEF